MAPTNPTRLAIVRCDTHAYWYGVFMDEPDVLALATVHDEAPTRPGIHNYFKEGNEYTRLKIERVEGFVISKLFDRIFEKGQDESGNPILQYGTYPGRAEQLSQTFFSRPAVCDTIQEAAEDVDAAYIADSSSPGDGADHLELARPFLERGIPTFVDKPFAATLTDAQEILRLAKANNTTVMTASILAHTEVGMHFKNRFAEIGDPGLLIVKGVGSANGAVIHGLGTAQGLFGYGVEWVECLGATPLECIQLYYPDGREAFVINGSQRVFMQTCSFFASAYSNQGVVHSPPIGDPEFHTGTRRIVEMFRQMIDTGEPPVPYEHMLEPIAIIEAATIAQREGRRVPLAEVWDGKA